MNKDINKEVGVSRSGFVAEQAGKVIASAETFNGLMRKKVVKKLSGSKTLWFRHVLPEGMTREIMGVDRDKKVSPQTSGTIAEAIMESGMPFMVVKIEPNPKIEKAVSKYVEDIEEAHRRAAHSKLRFGATCPLTQLRDFLFFRRATHQCGVMLTFSKNRARIKGEKIGL